MLQIYKLCKHKSVFGRKTSIRIRLFELRIKITMYFLFSIKRFNKLSSYYNSSDSFKI